MRRYIFGIMVALAVASCSKSGSSDESESSEEEEGTASSFTAFVIDLIENNTLDDAQPVSADEFMSLPDPDADENNVAAYQQLF